MKLKTYNTFMNEGDDNNPEDKQMNSKLKNKVEKEVAEVSNDCQRCGEVLKMCACEKDDWASTRNAHLIKPGKKESKTAKI
tara:strand:- start:33 stop:275 length:243 start_codon:yes stop_codon:yes gene_type:complete